MFFKIKKNDKKKIYEQKAQQTSAGNCFDNNS